MSHVAAVSWAAMQTPETTLGNHSATKAGFLSANQTEVFCFGSLAIGNRKDDPYPTRFNELIRGELLVVFGRQDPHVPRERSARYDPARCAAQSHQSRAAFSWIVGFGLMKSR